MTEEYGENWQMKVHVKVTPNSRTEQIKQEGDHFVVRVKDPPREGKANQAVVGLLADHFGVPKGRVRILSGFTTRNKAIEIVGV
jgi:uncharacterized protein (TIGR00251 family)